jgi:glycosyltransferase involved in cell wall biosynthesis
LGVTPAASIAQRGGILLIMNTLGRGGGDRVGMLLANGFARAGIPTRIALMKDAGTHAVLDGEVEVVSAGSAMGLRWSSNHPPLGHQHLERVRGVRFIRRQIGEFRPAVVLAASDNMGLVTALTRTRKHAGTLFAMKLTNRLFRPNTPAVRRSLRASLFNFIFKRLDAVLTLTEADRIDAIAHYPRSAHIFRTVPNPYVIDDMLAPSARRTDDGSHLLAAGRMVPQKRFDVLLRAFALIGIRNARLTILGDGPLRPELERLATSLGIAERVDMPGHVEVLPWLCRSDLFVLSSDYEGLPAVLIEALACNVPVVTTDSFHAARELFGTKASCAVVPIGDPRALAAAIDRSLAARNGIDLRALAEPYRIDTAIDAHIRALALPSKLRTARTGLHKARRPASGG